MPPVLVEKAIRPSGAQASAANAMSTSNEREKVQQLVTLLRAELDGSGQLSAIKAQLASTASRLVLCKNASHIKTGPVQIPGPTLSLLAECLDHYGFRHSLNTLLVESGCSREQLTTRPQLAKQLNVTDADGMDSGSLVDILSERSSAQIANSASIAATIAAPRPESAAVNPTTSSTATRAAPPALAPLRTATPSPPPAPSGAASVAAGPASTHAPVTTSPPPQPHTLANAAATRPHTAPPLTPLPPTPPKASANDVAPSQSALPPLVHPITVRSQTLGPRSTPIGASPPSPGPLDLSQLSSVPSQVTSEELGLSGGSSPASTSVLSTEDYSVSVSATQGGGMGGEFRGLGLESKRQVSAWLKDKEFHMMS